MNTSVVKALAADLGWDGLNIAEMLDWLTQSGVDPAAVVAFMRGVLANPDGVDPATIAGIQAAQLPYIEDWFRKRWMVF